MRKPTKTKKAIAGKLSIALEKAAEVFAGAPCRGRLYEPKCPTELLKKE